MAIAVAVAAAVTVVVVVAAAVAAAAAAMMAAATAAVTVAVAGVGAGAAMDVVEAEIRWARVPQRGLRQLGRQARPGPHCLASRSSRRWCACSSDCRQRA